jgi:glycosyltransferase involved in cell wall biosynthesis
MRNIYMIDLQYNNISSGPGRFCEYLRTQFPNLGFIVPAGVSDYPNISFINSRFWLLNSYRVNKIVKKLDQNSLVIYQSALEAIFAKKIDIVFVSDYNYLKPFGDLNFKHGFKRFLRVFIRCGYHYIEKRVVNRANIVVVNSEFMLELVQDVYNVKTNKIFRLYKGVDRNYFKKLKTESTKKISQFCFIKSDWRRGGLSDAIRFINFYAKTSQIACNLIIAGIPAKELGLIECILQQEAEFSFIVHGKLTKQSLLDLVYRKSDVYLNFASSEALGVACMEAISVGLLPVISGVGGMHEVVGKNYPLSYVNSSMEEIVEYLQNVKCIEEIKSKLDLRITNNFELKVMKKNVKTLFNLKSEVKNASNC